MTDGDPLSKVCYGGYLTFAVRLADGGVAPVPDLPPSPRNGTEQCAPTATLPARVRGVRCQIPSPNAGPSASKGKNLAVLTHDGHAPQISSRCHDHRPRSKVIRTHHAKTAGLVPAHGTWGSSIARLSDVEVPESF